MSHCLLASSDEKSVIICMMGPSCNVSFSWLLLPLPVCRLFLAFWLYCAYSSCLVFAEHIWAYTFMFFTKFWDFRHCFLKYFLAHSFLLLWGSNHTHAITWHVPWVTEILFISFIFLLTVLQNRSFLCYSYTFTDPFFCYLQYAVRPSRKLFLSHAHF